MLKNITRVLIILFMCILQTTLFQYLNINNVSPNLFIITIVSLSALRGRKEGLFYGAAFGLIQDIFYGNNVGFYILIYMLIATLAGYLYKNYYAESMVIPLVAIGVGDYIYNAIVYFFTYLMRGKIDLLYYVFNIIFPEITYTVFVAVLMYRLFILYSYMMNEYEKDKRKGDDDFYERNI